MFAFHWKVCACWCTHCSSVDMLRTVCVVIHSGHRCAWQHCTYVLVYAYTVHCKVKDFKFKSAEIFDLTAHVRTYVRVLERICSMYTVCLHMSVFDDSCVQCIRIL